MTLGALIIPFCMAPSRLAALRRVALEKHGEFSGEVRLDAPELLGQHILLPSLAPLALEYPDIRLDILSSVRPVRLTVRESNIVLRLVRPEHGSYKMRTVGRVLETGSPDTRQVSH